MSNSQNEHNEEMHFGHWMALVYTLTIAFVAAFIILAWVSG